MKKIHGFTYDEVALAKGIWDIIVQQGQEHLVSMGMLPNEIMEIFEDGIKEKVIEKAREQWECDRETAMKWIDKERHMEIVRTIVKDTSIRIYSVAKEEGLGFVI